MKFEVGKFYRTRDGHKVQILMLDNGCDEMICAVFEGGVWRTNTWTKRGSFYNLKYGEKIIDVYENIMDKSLLDIISEWREPIERKTVAWAEFREPINPSGFPFDRLGVVAIAEEKIDKCQTKVEIIVRSLSDE